MVRLATSAAHSFSVRYSEVKRQRVEVRSRCGVAQIHRQPVPERRHPGADAGLLGVPAEQPPDLPPDREEVADGERRALGRVVRRDQLDRQQEVVWAADRRELPYILKPEVVGELVDPPGPAGVRAVREPHSSTSMSVSRRPERLT